MKKPGGGSKGKGWGSDYQDIYIAFRKQNARRVWEDADDETSINYTHFYCLMAAISLSVLVPRPCMALFQISLLIY